MQKMLIIKRYHRVWWYLFLIVLNCVYIQNGVHVKGISLDVDENVVHKICQMKFCDASKSDVSDFRIFILISDILQQSFNAFFSLLYRLVWPRILPRANVNRIKIW